MFSVPSCLITIYNRMGNGQCEPVGWVVVGESYHLSLCLTNQPGIRLKFSVSKPKSFNNRLLRKDLELGQIIVMIIILVSSLVCPHRSVADTIILKSGRTIDATKCWEDGEIIKCKIYGQIVGYQKNDIAEAHLSTKPEKLLANK